jgi:hypothetical protein
MLYQYYDFVFCDSSDEIEITPRPLRVDTDFRMRHETWDSHTICLLAINFELTLVVEHCIQYDVLKTRTAPPS